MKKYIIITFITFFIGFLFFAYQKELLIIKIPSFVHIEEAQNEALLIKKNIKLFFWKNNKLSNEFNQILLSNNLADNIFKITANWLNLLDEEKIILEKISLQTALISKNQKIIYLSFDGKFLNEEFSTFNKLMIIESLLKTFRENDIKIDQVYFLVHHQEMKDTHLDFSHAWPISGFLS